MKCLPFSPSCLTHTPLYFPSHYSLTWVNVAEGFSIYFYPALDLSVKGIYDNEPQLQEKQQRC